MKLYMHPASSTSRPILFYCAEQNSPVDMEVVDLMTGAQYQEPFASVNPNNLVPVLEEEGGWRLTESSAILKYLAAKEGSALYPTDLQKRAKVDEAMDWFNTNFYREWAYHLIYPQVFDHHKRSSEDAQKVTLEWGKEKSIKALNVLDAHMLGNNAYLCGAEMTIADYFGASFISIGELIRADLSQWKNVSRWYKTMTSLPSWPKITEAHAGFAAMLKDKEFVTIG